MNLIKENDSNIFPEIIDTSNNLTEGQKKQITVNTFERNKYAREKCIDFYGTNCSVCKLDFKEKYGDMGKGFIHVHHLKPISKIGQTYKVDPKEDLRPVCPNCHAMLHRKEPAFSIQELKSIIDKNA